MEQSTKRREPDFATREEGSVTILEVLSDDLRRPGVARNLGEGIRDAVSAGRRQIVVNLGRVMSLDSAAVGELVAAVSSVQRDGGKVKLSDLSGEPKHILEAANLHHFFEIVPRENEAVKGFVAESTS